MRNPTMRRLLVVEAYELPESIGQYSQYLIKHGGRPMARALIRARQRYEKLRPIRLRASQLHTAYGRRRR